MNEVTNSSAMVFVDTGAWYVSVVVDDINHRAATDWLNRNTATLLTTDYVIDEVLTLLRVRGRSPLAVEIGELLFAGKLAVVVKISDADIRDAWSVSRQFGDKNWSFTDCTSRAVMNRLRVERAFAFDHHFR